MKPLNQTQAIVLKESELGESDKLLTLFSLDTGKLQCIAKGAKRSKKRFVNKLEQFTHLNIAYAVNRHSLHRLDQAEVIDHFQALRSDHHRYTAAALASDTLLHWIKENDADPSSFQLLAWTLRQLNGENNLTATLIFFFVKLLSLQGYQPIFDHCTQCGTPATASLLYCFSPRRFGIVCSNCQSDLHFLNNTLSLGLLKLLRQVQQLQADKLHRLHFSIGNQQKSFRLFEKYFSFLLHRDVDSWKMANAILFDPVASR